MKIEFEIWTEDLMAFNRHLMVNSPNLRRMRRNSAVSIGLAMLLGGILLSLLGESVVPGVMGVVLAGPAGLLMWFLQDYFTDRNVRRIVADGVNEALLGRRAMELTEHEIVTRSRYVTHSVDLCVIQKIEATDDYAFIYLSKMEALIVPRQDVPEDDFDDFVGTLRRQWRKVALHAPAEAD